MSATHIPIGTMVRVRTDIPKADHDKDPGITISMNRVFGCIGIVCEHSPNYNKIFFDGKEDSAAWFWLSNWVTTLGREDEAKMDAAWVKSLREAYAKQYPGKDEVEFTHATKRIKKTITELRDTLTALETAVGRLE